MLSSSSGKIKRVISNEHHHGHQQSGKVAKLNREKEEKEEEEAVRVATASLSIDGEKGLKNLAANGPITVTETVSKIVTDEAAAWKRNSSHPASSSLSNGSFRSSSPNLNQQHKLEKPEEGTANMLTLRRTVSDSDVSSTNSSESGGRGRSESISGGNWGWFEDVHDQHHHKQPPVKSSSKTKGSLLPNPTLGVKPLDDYVKPSPQKEISGAVTAPIYVLEESPSTQKLWKDTAGNRPPQPVEERAFFEKMWAQNFVKSQVIYQMPVEVLTATSPISLSPFADGNFPEDTRDSTHTPHDYTYSSSTTKPNKNNKNNNNSNNTPSVAAAAVAHDGNPIVYRHYGPSRSNNLKSLGPHHHHHTLVNKKVKCDEDGELVVVVRGDNVFGTTVSKSFGNVQQGVDTVSISIASYRVVESKKHGKYAQFLVIYCEGSFRDTVGVWKRYSDFDTLSQKVTHGADNCSSMLAGIHPLHTSTEEPDHPMDLLPNAITSWRLLKKRQRWYRCLDAGYLSLKVFLLERFLHDILFESSSPHLLRDFVGIDMRDNKLVY